MDLTLPSTLTRLFVTEIYRTELKAPGFDAFMDSLDDTCRAMADDDVAGQEWSRRHGYLGYTSYASVESLAGYATVFDDLRKMIDSHVAIFAKQIDLDLGDKRLKMQTSWVNILERLGHHSGHIHPHSLISGTFYVSVPEGSSALRFEDPRLGLMMNAPLRAPSARADRQTFASIAPLRGTLVLWESWLRHEVPINLAEDVRISISFNYS
jgi:uncharacterized protein (TIGR02466 family)